MTEDSSTNHDVRQLERIVQYCENIEEAILIFGQDEEDFLDNVQYQHACAFATSQIGERVKRLSTELKQAVSDIEWKEIAGFRNVLSHEYEHVNMSVFWNTINKDISVLKKRCESLIIELRGRSSSM